MNIDYAAIAFTRLQRLRALMHYPHPPELRVTPPTAQQAVASDDRPLSPRSSPEPLVSAVEAGRHATQSDPGDECDCPACTSDCGRIAPCMRKDD